jgi:hypothetical protein
MPTACAKESGYLYNGLWTASRLFIPLHVLYSPHHLWAETPASHPRSAAVTPGWRTLANKNLLMFRARPAAPLLTSHSGGSRNLKIERVPVEFVKRHFLAPTGHALPMVYHQNTQTAQNRSFTKLRLCALAKAAIKRPLPEVRRWQLRRIKPQSPAKQVRPRPARGIILRAEVGVSGPLVVSHAGSIHGIR